MLQDAGMAGDQRYHEHRLLARRMRTRRKSVRPLAQLLQVSRQALITDDFRHRSFLQAAIGVDDPLLVVGEKNSAVPNAVTNTAASKPKALPACTRAVFAQTRHGGVKPATEQ